VVSDPGRPGGALAAAPVAPREPDGWRPAFWPRGPASIAVVQADRCIGCGICLDACADHALSVNGSAAVDPARCSGCGACVPECPTEALSLEPLPLARGATG
jgi:ferredoxin